MKPDTGYEQWTTVCPNCGAEELYIIAVTAAADGERYYPDIPLESDGFYWEPEDPDFPETDYSTEDETARCRACEMEYPLNDLSWDHIADQEVEKIKAASMEQLPLMLGELRTTLGHEALKRKLEGRL